MKEYIEKEAFRASLNETIYNSCGDLLKVGGLKQARDLLEAFTPADVKPVVRGEWKISFLYQYAVGYKCSCCDYFQLHRTRFCPNCGADMRKEVNDD